MALINCPECGKEISDTAESCPHCGYIMNNIKSDVNQKKKKSLIGIIIIIVVIIIVAIILCSTLLKKDDSFALSENTLGIQVTEEEVKELIKDDNCKYLTGMLNIVYKSHGKTISKSVIFEEDSFPSTVVGVGETYGYTFGTMAPAYNTMMCNSADECKDKGENEFAKDLDKAIKKYGDDYKYEETEVGYGMRKSYKWTITDKIYYSLSTTEGTEYYPEFNQYSISQGFFYNK